MTSTKRLAAATLLLSLILVGCGEAKRDCHRRSEAEFIQQGHDQPEAAGLARGWCSEHTSYELTDR